MSGNWVRVPEPGDDEAEEPEGAGEAGEAGGVTGAKDPQGPEPEPPTPPQSVSRTAPPSPTFGHDDWDDSLRPSGGVVSEPCWNCRAPVAPRDTHCASCGKTRTHVLLVCTDPCLELRHGPGPPLALGRHPDWAPRTAAAFADRPKISRRHVSITVEPDGSAWAEEPPEGSHNGTFINGAKLMPGFRTPLRDGDQLRLGLRISIAVRLHGPDHSNGPSPGTSPG